MPTGTTEERATGKGKGKAAKADPKPKRVAFAKVQAAEGRVLIRLNAVQARDLFGTGYTPGAKQPLSLVAKDLPAAAVADLTRAATLEAGPRWYWDDTAVVFVSPATAIALYQWSFSRREQENGGNAHLLGARSLYRRQLARQLAPEAMPADLEAAQAA